MKDEKTQKNKYEQKYKIAMIIVFTAFTTFMLTTLTIFSLFVNGERVGNYVLVEPNENNQSISEKLDTYKKIIDLYYLGEVDEEKLTEGAIKGYISGLGDPYTEYISKDEMKSYMDDVEGNFIGIGIYMTRDNKTNLIKIVSIIKDSPAEKNGIKPGDLIKKIDGVEYTNDDFDTISTKVKGEAGTTVKLELLRGDETIELDVLREKIIVNKIESKVLENNIGYIQIPSFDETTSDEFKTKYEELKSNNVNSLIIDLRNNGGGIVIQALNIADYIADKDSVLLYEVDKNGKEKINKSENEPIVDIPIVVLVNENTASSSEILAGALKDLGKAKIVGTTTFGKGIIQTILPLPDGSGLKITTDEYQTPNKNKIHKKGIEPDEVVELPDNIKSKLEVEESEDTQLKKAIELLK